MYLLSMFGIVKHGAKNINSMIKMIGAYGVKCCVIFEKELLSDE